MFRFAFSALLCSACSLHTVQVSELSISPAAPIFETVSEPLYIVLDEVPLRSGGGDRSPELRQVRALAFGPLKASLQPYFSDVVVMESSTWLPATPHHELWLKVESISSQRVGTNMFDQLLARSVPTLEWEAVLIDRVSGGVPFNYHATFTGQREMTTVTGSSQAYEEMFEDALRDLAGELVNSGTVKLLRDGPIEAPVEAPVEEPIEGSDSDAVSEAPRG